MARTYDSGDAADYVMSYAEPHRVLEPPEREVGVVDDALAALVDVGILSHATYGHEAFLAHRQALAREELEIPWTAISPRMQRLLYAINAIARPRTMVAMGVFCGYTFLANAGAAVGPGAVYAAQRLVGIEIDPDEAARAQRNVDRLDPTGTAAVIAADGIAWAARCDPPIDLLYLDADGAGGRGKAVYLDILMSAWDALPEGALVLAHNSINAAKSLKAYSAFVRDPANCRASLNVIFDTEGLEVSQR